MKIRNMDSEKNITTFGDLCVGDVFIISSDDYDNKPFIKTKPCLRNNIEIKTMDFDGNVYNMYDDTKVIKLYAELLVSEKPFDEDN